MTILTIESLGLSKEELQDRVIQRICDQALISFSYDDEGNDHAMNSQFKRELDKKIKDQINATIDGLAQKHVLPNVHQYIENLVLQETNRWGESKGEPMTFVEYLIQRTEEYIKEEVNFEGKTKADVGSFHWSKSQTRIAHMIHKHLQYNIEQAVKTALADANSHIVGGLEKAVRIKMQEISSAFKVSIKS